MKMENSFWSNWLVQLSPAALVPAALKSFGADIAPEKLIALGALLGMFMMASRGVHDYFPKTKFAEQPLSSIFERCLATGLLFGAGMTLLNYLALDNAPRDTARMLNSFVLMSLFFGLVMFLLSLIERRRRTQA
jgi:hypothetical protein